MVAKGDETIATLPLEPFHFGHIFQYPRIVKRMKGTRKCEYCGGAVKRISMQEAFRKTTGEYEGSGRHYCMSCVATHVEITQGEINKAQGNVNKIKKVLATPEIKKHIVAENL